jgi:thymidylate synthase ThyX
MEIRFLPQINGLADVAEVKKDAQIAGRQCYSEKDAEELFHEPYNPGLVEGRLLPCGHHSPFEHKHLTFAMKGIPKILAMALNNERPYVTSEKSARYTVMKDVVPEQKRLYDKWLEILNEEISRNYPEDKFPGMYVKDGSGKNAINKLSQENARYMTSVFTPTNMIHTIEARQLNFILEEFEKYYDRKANSLVEFEKRFASLLPEFIEQMTTFKIPGLKNQTDRHLSLFREESVEEHFGEVYATNYTLSFAGLAQAHRHRTISYTMQTPKIGEDDAGFFVPGILKSFDLNSEWLEDLSDVAKNDFPQAQLLGVTERGRLEDFRSKCILRLCSHAQYEIMQNTKATAIKYSTRRPVVIDWIKPKCQQGMKCASPCIIGSSRALERIV